jgi:hypothetical protein
MTESSANLYVGPYIKSTKRQSSYLEVAIAASTLELPQLLLKSLYVAAEYIPSRPTMSKMGYGESIAATSCHTHHQELAKRAFESRPQLMESAANPSLQYTETELNGAEVGRIWRQISYETTFRMDSFGDNGVAMRTGIIEYDHALRAREWIAVR